MDRSPPPPVKLTRARQPASRREVIDPIVALGRGSSCGAIEHFPYHPIRPSKTGEFQTVPMGPRRLTPISGSRDIRFLRRAFVWPAFHGLNVYPDKEARNEPDDDVVVPGDLGGRLRLR